MPIEFSDYIETRLDADALDGTEYWILSQGGESRKFTTDELVAYISEVIGPVTSNSFRGGWDLSGDTPPSGSGSGSAGANRGGDTWYASAGGNINLGDGAQFFPENTMITAKFDGATNPTDFLWQP